MDAVWHPLAAELARWHDCGRQIRFWLRDDDAVTPTPALERLVRLGRDNAVPVTLAVIPLLAKEALAEWLANEEGITVTVHGWSHRNHASIAEKKQELGPHRPRPTITNELRNGVERIGALFPRRFLPVLVPPWNRIDPSLVPELPALGFEGLSVFGPVKAVQKAILPVINTHIDLMDWHGTRGCRPHGELVEEIVRALRQRFDGGAEPIGILAHHLVHDESAWLFLEGLFEIVAASSSVRWAPLSELIDYNSTT